MPLTVLVDLVLVKELRRLLQQDEMVWSSLFIIVTIIIISAKEVMFHQCLSVSLSLSVCQFVLDLA